MTEWVHIPKAHLKNCLLKLSVYPETILGPGASCLFPEVHYVYTNIVAVLPVLSAAHFNSCYFLIHLFIFIFLNKNLIFWRTHLKKKKIISICLSGIALHLKTGCSGSLCQNTGIHVTQTILTRFSQVYLLPLLTYYLSLPTPFLCLFFLHFAFSPSWRNVIHICPHFCNNHISNICGYIPSFPFSFFYVLILPTFCLLCFL